MAERQKLSEAEVRASSPRDSWLGTRGWQITQSLSLWVVCPGVWFYDKRGAGG